MDMNGLINLSTHHLATFLLTELPSLSEEWWKNNVNDRLSFQQQRLVNERGITTLEELDFAALIRILDQNWFDLSNTLNFPRNGRNWIKEAQSVRNRWAHLSSESISPETLFRDVDTLSKVLDMIGVDLEKVPVIEEIKTAAINEMSLERQSLKTDIHSKIHKAKASVVSDSTRIDSQPEAKHKYDKGDLVVLIAEPEKLLSILDVKTGLSEPSYSVLMNGKKVIFYESQLTLAPDSNTGPVTLTATKLRAYLTSHMLRFPSSANLYSLHTGKVKFIPYQYRPVLKLIKADRPRLLIADEVGVGKTIETGLIIKELRARMDISSVLIICPKSLVAEKKWSTEMKRFDEKFYELDGNTLRHCVQETHLEGQWPDKHAKSIVPFSLIDSDLLFGKEGRKKVKGLLGLDPPPKFDLVIVDEAHHLRNSETFLHQGVRYFCDNASAVVFLTATPVQLGSNDLYTLLNILRPDLIVDSNSFQQMAKPNASINKAINHCRGSDGSWQLKARHCLDTVSKTDWGRMFMRESPVFQSIYDKLGDETIDDSDRINLIHELEELYTFSSIINRTRRRDIGEFTTRKAETLTIKFTSQQQKLHDDLLNLIAIILKHSHGQTNVKFMMTTIRRQAASCIFGLAPLLGNILDGKIDQIEVMEASDNEIDINLNFVSELKLQIEQLLVQANELDSTDPKVDSFIRVLQSKKEMANKKALVFSTFRHTLSYLARYCDQFNFRYGLIHGDIPDEERRELRKRFSLPDDDPDALDILLSSEVGCEGLDFQFCDLLINYDLPWNPMRIEQRIGRIDRYGQESETIAIVNLITPGTVDADIYERCLSRIGVFQHAVGGNEDILGKVTKDLHDIADSFTLTPEQRLERLKQLGDNSIRQIKEEQDLENSQAHFFGLTVPNQKNQDDKNTVESFWLSNRSLSECVISYFEQRLGVKWGVKKPLKNLRLTSELRSQLLADFKRLPRNNDPIHRQWEKWLKDSGQALMVTFDHELASENSDAVYLNVLHPLIKQAADHLVQDEAVQVYLTTECNEVEAGEYPFAIYRWNKRGVTSDELLVPVSNNVILDDLIMSILQSATDIDRPPTENNTSYDDVEFEHHRKWSEERSEHINKNREFVSHKLQSLTASHKARCKVLEGQIVSANDEKILIMKKAELQRAESNFIRQCGDLEIAAKSGDIHTNKIVFGSISIKGIS